jgi:NADH:ubiquinone oxidoreductase subunit 6 (subunit J)
MLGFSMGYMFLFFLLMGKQFLGAVLYIMHFLGQVNIFFTKIVGIIILDKKKKM